MEFNPLRYPTRSHKPLPAHTQQQSCKASSAFYARPALRPVLQHRQRIAWPVAARPAASPKVSPASCLPPASPPAPATVRTRPKQLSGDGQCRREAFLARKPADALGQLDTLPIRESCLTRFRAARRWKRTTDAPQASLPPDPPPDPLHSPSPCASSPDPPPRAVCRVPSVCLLFSRTAHSPGDRRERICSGRETRVGRERNSRGRGAVVEVQW